MICIKCGRKYRHLAKYAGRQSHFINHPLRIRRKKSCLALEFHENLPNGPHTAEIWAQSFKHFNTIEKNLPSLHSISIQFAITSICRWSCWYAISFFLNSDSQYGFTKTAIQDCFFLFCVISVRSFLNDPTFNGIYNSNENFFIEIMIVYTNRFSARVLYVADILFAHKNTKWMHKYENIAQYLRIPSSIVQFQTDKTI